MNDEMKKILGVTLVMDRLETEFDKMLSNLRDFAQKSLPKWTGKKKLTFPALCSMQLVLFVDLMYVSMIFKVTNFIVLMT